MTSFPTAVPGFAPGALTEGTRAVFGRLGTRAWAFVRAHPVLLVTLLVTAVIRSWNFTGTPATWNDDEGTYTAQAYAMLHYGTIAHYTYWYDHPFLGWLQIAAWAWLTDGFARYNDTAIMIGRELVAIYGVVSGALLYGLCRQLRIAKVFSGIALVLFMVSPIALFYGKMVFLDNLMVPWLLASLVFAVAAGKRMLAVIPSGICFGIAFLTKETVLPFVVALLALVAVSSGKGFRFRNVVYTTAFLTFFGVAAYIVFAAIKGELLQGPGHVSLESAIRWQLLTRTDSGPILAHNSTFMGWLDLDPYLLAGGLAMSVLCLFRLRFLPVAALVLVGAALIVRGGYLPSPYVIVLLPIAALSIAAAAQVIWETGRQSRFLQVGTSLLGSVLIVLFAIQAGPLWTQRAVHSFTNDGVRSEQQAIGWVTSHSPAADGNRIIADENVWIDLINRGYARDSVDWFYKVDSDPAVKQRYLPADGNPADAWQSVDYVVIPDIGKTIIASVPTMRAAIAHSHVVATFGGAKGHGFGSYIVYKVSHEGEK